MAMAPSWSNIGGGLTDLYNISTKKFYNRQGKNETDVRFRQTKVKGVSPHRTALHNPLQCRYLVFLKNFPNKMLYDREVCIDKGAATSQLVEK